MGRSEVGFSSRPYLARTCRTHQVRAEVLPRHARAGGHPGFRVATSGFFPGFPLLRE